MQGVMKKIELAEDHLDVLDSHREITSEKYAKKDAKRQRELARIQEKINETVIADPNELHKQVDEELGNSLLRMTELRILADMQNEELEKELA